jgi:hypothetical protein
MRRAVQRGLERRQLDRLKYLGMDEKSFRRGQSYVTLLTDLEDIQGLVWLGKPQPPQAGGRCGTDAQASSGQLADLP